MPAEPEKAQEVVTNRLREAMSAPDAKDSPLYPLLDDYPNIQHEKTDVFQKQAEQSKQRRQQLATARRTKRKEAVKAVEDELGPIRDEDTAVVIDLFLAYRDVKAWDEMVSLVEKMSKPLANTVLVQGATWTGAKTAPRVTHVSRVTCKRPRNLVPSRGHSQVADWCPRPEQRNLWYSGPRLQGSLGGGS
jgi:hypothetical protein